MATFTFKPQYTYVPTPPRPQSATARRRPALKQSSILDKLQRSKLSEAELSMPQPAAANDIRGNRLRIQETGTVNDGDENDDDYDFPSIEQLLYTTLQKEGFAAEGQRLSNEAFRVGDATAGERGGSLENKGPALGDNSSGSPEDPIVLLGDNDSSASEVEVDNGGLRAESAAADEGLLNCPETAIDSTTPAPLNPDAWHDIDTFLETAQRLRRSEQKPSTSDSMRHHIFSSSRSSSEPLHDHISAADQCKVRASSETTMSYPARPRNQPPDHLPTDRSEPSQDKLGSHSGSCSDDELSNTPESDDVDGRPRPAKRKRKRPSSPNNGPMHKKRKHHLEQRPTRQHRPRCKPYRRSLKSHSPLDQGSRVAAVSSAKGRLPSPAPSALQTMDTEISPDCCSLGPSSGDILPTLTEVTFRPHSTRCCSFTAVVREGCDGQGVSFSQVAQLIESIGHVGKIDDFTIKPLQQHLFLLTGFSRHTLSRLSSSGATVLTVPEGNRVKDDATRSQLWYGRAVDSAGAVAPRGSEPSSSDHDGGLSDSDPDSSSDDDRCSSEDKQGRSSTRKNIPWDPIDEQRLLAYRKEDKPWSWIFHQFSNRTPPAVRTRWNMLRPRDE